MPEERQDDRVDGFDALAAACDRNAPLGVVRPERAGRDPIAHGRLLSLGDEAVAVEDVRVIGRDLTFSTGAWLDAYFSAEGVMYRFRTKVLSAAEPVRLNQSTVVKGMMLLRPREVTLGQRRNAFRVPLHTALPPNTADVWRPSRWDGEHVVLEPGLDLRPIMQDRKPDHLARMADASDRGLGLILPEVSYLTLSVFEQLIVRIPMPTGPPPLFAVEVRQIREAQDRGARIGALILPDCPPDTYLESIRRLRERLDEIQREQLRRRNSAA